MKALKYLVVIGIGAFALHFYLKAKKEGRVSLAKTKKKIKAKIDIARLPNLDGEPLW